MPSTPPEPDYYAWKERTFGSDYMIWHDGLYVDAVTSLRGPARDEAIRMLEAGLALGDSHAAEALAAMGHASALPGLRRQLAAARGAERVRVALAIHALAPDAALAGELVSVLANRRLFWSERIDAAIGLRAFADPASEEALREALTDLDYLVRYHAAESLLARWGVRPGDIAEHRDVFALLRLEATDAGAAERWAEARALLVEKRGR